MPVYLLDCQQAMPTIEEASALPPLDNKALILYTGNMYQNDYGSKSYFDQTDTSIQKEALLEILNKSPKLILIDSYGIGKHGSHHQELDKLCETFGCYVIENIRIAPQEVEHIRTVHIKFDLDYPSTGKPCTDSAEEVVKKLSKKKQEEYRSLFCKLQMIKISNKPYHVRKHHPTSAPNTP